MKRNKQVDNFFIGFFFLIFLVPALVYILFFLNILIEGVPVISWQYLTSSPSSDLADGGIGPVIVATLGTVVMMLVFVVPFGVMTALYLSEYSLNKKFDKFFIFLLYNLSGVPSVVFGIFGLGFFVLNMGSSLDNFF
jgi:phosphate transport system permease protein